MKSGQGIYAWEGGKAKIDASQQSQEFGPMDFCPFRSTKQCGF